jgi:hypothetical protein
MADEKTVNVDAYDFKDQVMVKDDSDQQGYLIDRNGDTVGTLATP